MIRDGRSRVVIQAVDPQIDGGRFSIKRVVGEKVVVQAEIFADGHDLLSSLLLYRKKENADWMEVPMKLLANDRWQGAFAVKELGTYLYTIQAWVDDFQSWRRGIARKAEAGQDVSADLLAGAQILEHLSRKAAGSGGEDLRRWAEALRSAKDPSEGVRAALDEDLFNLTGCYPDKDFASLYDPELSVTVDREKARFSTWYELFPRSCSSETGKHGTFKDCESRLPYVSAMGFDVLYLPPIHPIGRVNRRGKNNVPSAGPEDVGSPWAIGSAEGGHKAVHPLLGTLQDFRRLVAKAKEHGLEMAIDLAFQCAPDHPYVKEHPEWFRRRPDGTVQFAENPPKRYEDIYPFDFTTPAWRELWEELKRVVFFWIDQGVRIFRADNPHTKPFAFWEWLIGTVKENHPEAIFLSEAFTRPKVMHYLAKCGFTQSYTYFAWRNTKEEITQYFSELNQMEVREYFRPNLWPNTPDILTESLQMGGRPAFMTRLVLAATLGASYGIYGPAFELGENTPRDLGSEEYLDSEKYETKKWDLENPRSLEDFIGRLNRIRKENPALQRDGNLKFHPVDNEQILCYSKQVEDPPNTVLVAVNLDPHHRHSGWVNLSLEDVGGDPKMPYQVHDLLSGARYLWTGPRNYVEIDPQIVPAHIFRIRRRIRTERDFDYFL